MTDKIEFLIKNYLENRKTSVSGQREDAIYPSPEVLYDYLTDELKGPELERMLAFLRNNSEAQQLISKSREIMDSESGWENEKVPQALLNQAKSLMRPRSLRSRHSAAALKALLRQKNAAGVCPHCGKLITPFKRPLHSQQWKNVLWFGLAVLSFALSFVLRRFFYQFLAATLLFGFKWIVEQRATKTQIMIYKALSDDTGSERNRLHEHSPRL